MNEIIIPHSRYNDRDGNQRPDEGNDGDPPHPPDQRFVVGNPLFHDETKTDRRSGLFATSSDEPDFENLKREITQNLLLSSR